MKNILIIFFVFFLTSNVLANSILVNLVSYEDKKDYSDNDTCELEFDITNKSWGTMYGYKIETEVFDDRGDKVEQNLLFSKIDAFGGIFNSYDSIGIGQSGKSTSLTVKTKCKYLAEIKLLEVKDKNCNIRMLPEDADCLEPVEVSSEIDHIILVK